MREVDLKIHWLWLLSLPLWMLPGLYFSRGDLLEAVQAAFFYAVVIIFLAILPHELGHAFVSCCFGVRKGTVHIAGLFGAWMPDEDDWLALRVWQRNLAILAGPIVNFILFGICSWMESHCRGLIPLLAYRVVEVAAVVNICLAVANLLPVFPLDGGRLFGSALHCLKLSPQWVGRVLLITTIALCGGRLFYVVWQREWLAAVEAGVFMLLSVFVILLHDFEEEQRQYVPLPQQRAFRDWKVRNW